MSCNWICRDTRRLTSYTDTERDSNQAERSNQGFADRNQAER